MEVCKKYSVLRLRDEEMPSGITLRQGTNWSLRYHYCRLKACGVCREVGEALEISNINLLTH